MKVYGLKTENKITKVKFKNEGFFQDGSISPIPSLQKDNEWTRLIATANSILQKKLWQHCVHENIARNLVEDFLFHM